MKNYIIDNSEASNYIKDVRKGSNGTLVIEFADGKIFTKVDASPENMEKIIAKQEAQAKHGIDNYYLFRNQVRRSRRRTFFSGVGAFVAGAGLTFIPAVQNALSSQNPLSVVAGVGIITILGAIPAYVRLCRDKGTLEELDKLRYRNAHLNELRHFREYPNALSNLNPRVANWMRNENDPFSILNIDCYGKEDLEQIVENIGVEKAYGFTYQKGNVRSR